MTNEQRRGGFTLLEIMIVVAVLTILVSLTFPPLFNSLRIVGHEGAMLNMDRSANRALNAVTAELRQAILPIKINDINDNNVAVSDDVILGDIADFIDDELMEPLSFARFMNNDTVGFGTNGQAWLSVLQRGTDFLPFTVPVPFVYEDKDGGTSVTTLDSAMLPQLGIFMADESPQIAAKYNVTPEDVIIDDVDDITTRSRLLWNPENPIDDITDVSPIHPSLALMKPDAYGLQTGVAAPVINLATDARFQPNPFAATGTERACGVIRFAPLIDETGAPFTLAENNNAAFDLNEDGVLTDTYALGRIEILYLSADEAPTMQTITVSTNTVLLQTNTASPSYRPLFQLRREEGGGYAVDINLLLCDGLSQRSNVISFTRITPYIVRRYNSSVELRNMAFR